MASKIDTDKLKAIKVNLSKPSSNVEKKCLLSICYKIPYHIIPTKKFNKLTK